MHLAQLLRADTGAPPLGTLREDTAIPAAVWTAGRCGDLQRPCRQHRVPQESDTWHGKPQGHHTAGPHGHGAAEDTRVAAQL